MNATHLASFEEFLSQLLATPRISHREPMARYIPPMPAFPERNQRMAPMYQKIEQNEKIAPVITNLPFGVVASIDNVPQGFAEAKSASEAQSSACDDIGCSDDEPGHYQDCSKTNEQLDHVSSLAE